MRLGSIDSHFIEFSGVKLKTCQYSVTDIMSLDYLNIRVEVVLVVDNGKLSIVATERKGSAVEDATTLEHSISQAEVLWLSWRSWGLRRARRTRLGCTVRRWRRRRGNRSASEQRRCESSGEVHVVGVCWWRRLMLCCADPPSRRKPTGSLLYSFHHGYSALHTLHALQSINYPPHLISYL